MKEQKLTQWYPAHVKPVRKGFYQTKIDSTFVSYWDGDQWCYGYKPEAPCWVQARPWRGLAEEPK